jgi:hypothetical protein
MSAVVLKGWGADVTGSNIEDGGAKARINRRIEIELDDPPITNSRIDS